MGGVDAQRLDQQRPEVAAQLTNAAALLKTMSRRLEANARAQVAASGGGGGLGGLFGLGAGPAGGPAGGAPGWPPRIHGPLGGPGFPAPFGPFPGGPLKDAVNPALKGVEHVYGILADAGFAPKLDRGVWGLPTYVGEKVVEGIARAEEYAPSHGPWSRWVGKPVSKVAPVVGPVMAGWDQWRTDSEQHPGMSTETKVARAGFVAGMSLSGQLIGMGLGAATAEVTGPVGAEVGSLGGSMAGEWLGKSILDYADSGELDRDVAYVKEHPESLIWRPIEGQDPMRGGTQVDPFTDHFMEKAAQDMAGQGDLGPGDSPRPFQQPRPGRTTNPMIV